VPPAAAVPWTPGAGAGRARDAVPCFRGMRTSLAPALVEAVLERLGLDSRPEPDAAGLAAVHEAFCSRVPFDNVLKRIQLAEGAGGALPGDEPAAFFAAWLRHGTGGTCWALSGALHALLTALGFRATRGLSTMLVAPDLPPNHGTVAVQLEGELRLADPVLKLAAPLRLDPRAATAVDHPARGARCEPKGAAWTVHWRPLHLAEPLGCRIDRLGASAADFASLHEGTRAWSPFNFQLYVRLARGDALEGLGFGQRQLLDASGALQVHESDEVERRRYLVEVAGMSEEIASRLPPDVPTPPPPGSDTSARSAAADRG
jgi:N-hydroxyarylamine O-acetyltransferase